MGGIFHVVGKVFKTATRVAPAIVGGIVGGPWGAAAGGALSGAFQRGNKLRNMGMGALTGAISYGVGNYASGAFAKSYGTQMLNTFGTNVGGALLQAPLYITQAYGASSAASGAREAYMQSVAKRSAKEALGSGMESSSLQYLSESSAQMQGQIAAELQATRELDAQRMKFREESQAKLMEAFFKNMPKPQPVNISFPALEDKIEEPPVIRPLDPKVENEPIQQMVFARNAHRTRRRTIDQYNYKGFEKPKKPRAIGGNPFADLTVKNG